MRNLIFAVFSVLILVPLASAQANLTFAWEHDGLNTTGYQLVVCPTAGATDLTPCTVHVIAGPSARQYRIENQPVGESFARARAYNVGVPEDLVVYSGFSNEVRFVVPVTPVSPSSLGANGQMIAMQFTLPADRNAEVVISLNKIP
jgi:hypothetical protein